MNIPIRLLIVVLLTITLGIAALGQGGPGPGGGGGGGGNRPPTETTTNLSYPANFFGTSLQTAAIGTYNLGATFPSGMSYGCLVKETIGTTTYDNTSCVTATANGFTADTYDACVARCTALGATKVERIYWQKNTSNQWQAGYELPGSAKLSADYIDWGDNLESKTWPAQVIRVETNTFSTWADSVPNGVTSPRLRFDLWHVFGAGTNELWGVHATEPVSGPSVPYVYLDATPTPNWPYAVNVTPKARLNITKLETGASACPAAFQATPYSPTWVPNTDGTGAWIGDETKPTYTLVDMLYGAELNIKGSYVYGYNWNLRSQVMPAGVDKAGWWRLTFYTADNSVDFSQWTDPSTAGVNTLAPPTSTDVTPGIFPSTLMSMAVVSTSGDRLRTQDRDQTRLSWPSTASEITPAADTGMLYIPQVDKTNQLTYIDICIKSGSGGGGKRP